MTVAALQAWINAEFARRTAAVEAGTADLDWVVPEYRVSWSEVWSKAEELGLSMSLVDLRLAVTSPTGKS